MACTNPRCALVPLGGGSPRFLMGDYPAGVTTEGKIVYLPCGNCLGCRLDRRQELTFLQSAEASLHEYNWFLTLTYDDWKCMQFTGLPPYSLNKQHLSDFIESMRKYCKYNKADFRFFACGEYGERFERPHYHLSIFGLHPRLLKLDDDDNVKHRIDFLDRGKLRSCINTSCDNDGSFHWVSPVISKRWLFGNHRLYLANHDTFQYVASYSVKRLTGMAKDDWLKTNRELPFFNQSRPSIGKPWFDKFHNDLSVPDGDNLVNDYLSFNGSSFRVPRIMHKWFDSIDHFQGKYLRTKISAIRSSHFPDVPDRDELKRKDNFLKYRAERYNHEQKHKEIT